MVNQLDHPPPSPALPAEGREENRAEREVIAAPFLNSSLTLRVGVRSPALLREPVVEAEEATLDESEIGTEGGLKIFEAFVGGVGLEWVSRGDGPQVGGEFCGTAFGEIERQRPRFAVGVKCRALEGTVIANEGLQ